MRSIGPYAIESELARGGMGIVYRARDQRLGREVVVKLLRIDDERSRARLQREAQAMAQLVHPNIVPLLDVGEHAGHPCLVLPLVKGESLQDRLSREGTLPVNQVVAIGAQIGKGLQAAHELGLVHRDVKPDNVLLDQRGNALLTDFGLVKTVSPGVSQTVSLSVCGRFMGTPGFWPREQAFGELEKIGPASDVYALGATLYALLCGQAPRHGASIQEALQAFAGDAPRPSESRDKIPLWLDDLIFLCLDDEPDHRPTLDELVHALDLHAAKRKVRRDKRSQPSSKSSLPKILLSLVPATALTIGVALYIFTRANLPLDETAVGQTVASDLASQEEPAQPQREPSRERSPQPPAERRPEPSPDVMAEVEERARRATELLESVPGHVLKGEHAQASAACEAAIELDPSNPLCFANLAAVKFAERRYVEAIEAYGRQLELEPTNASAYRGRGLCKSYLEQHEGALADFDRALELDPRLAEAYANRAVTKTDLGRHATALPDYDKAIELGVETGLVYGNRGFAKMFLDLPAEALEDFEHALELGVPESVSKQLELMKSRVIAQLGESAGEEGKEQARVWLEKGNQHLSMQRYAAAEAAYDRALALDPTLGEAYAQRGRSRARQAKHEAAIEDFDRALRSTPEESQVWANRGLSHHHAGNSAQAVKDFDRAIELDLGVARYYAYRAVSRYQLGHYEETAKDVDMALELGLPQQFVPKLKELRKRAWAKQ